MTSVRTKISLAVLGGALASFALLAGPSGAEARGKAPNALRAISTARATAAGRAYDIESEHRGRAAVWEVKVSTAAGAVEVVVSGNGRRALSHRSLARPDEEARWVRSTTVSLATAVRTAAGEAAGRLDEAELDREDGRLVWSASFGSGPSEVEIEVDAQSGRVVGSDSD